ncbi:hypothetical protein HYO65_gp113 [Tenacibaculum phage PTm1]|uniref:Uncharacterized protein n=2 Tax=Shirahamavirus PTm1 TaxID=2846435 RepID=A0A5S9BZC6_9CAUD|nr:hypothetical protein HYO65_gp113 [Tenacibaculum phage PTm1]BBI90505.1 hypothetical protein [Tenacibaculum phage PTm1]BBI90813.1 hypothetical protein [Tenacibaculum phage PTm5]
MAIHLIEEPAELHEQFRVYEKCFFGCGNSTKYWHAGTNQPVCKSCAKVRKTSELPKCTPDYKPKTKKEYTK